MLQSMGSCPWILQARILEREGHALLPGIFLMQESNQGLLHRRQILYYLSYQGGKAVYIYIYISDFIVHSRLHDPH